LARPPDVSSTGPDSRPGPAGETEAAEIESAAARLLVAREHGRTELRRKLLIKGYEAEAIDAVLEALERRGWLSDRRYVEAYVLGRRRKGYGPLRIRAELQERGIAAVEIDEGLRDSGDEWWSQMVAAAERRFGTAPAADRREQGRRARFLQQRGYPPDMIRRLLWE
jgi:regulatory protein